MPLPMGRTDGAKAGSLGDISSTGRSRQPGLVKRQPTQAGSSGCNRDSAVAGHWGYKAEQWLAAHLQTAVIEPPGAHMGCLGQPEHFAKELPPILGRLT